MVPAVRRRIARTPRLQPGIPRDARAFVCPFCDFVLSDGVLYTTCPACDSPVDQVDLRLPIWCCGGCDHMVNETVATEPTCAHCGGRPMSRIAALENPHHWTAPPLPGWFWRFLDSRFFPILLYLGALAPVLSLALDPRWRLFALALFGPFLLAPVALAGLTFWSLGASWGELSDLARDRRTRVVHGLEHVTIRLLEAKGRTVVGGLTHRGWFEVTVPIGSDIGPDARRANHLFREMALQAVATVRSEPRLAYHPRCGTSLALAITLASLGGLVAGGVGLFAHASFAVLLGILLANGLLLAFGSRPLGLLAQRLWTVSTSFRNAELGKLVRRSDHHHVVYAIHVDVSL